VLLLPPPLLLLPPPLLLLLLLLLSITLLADPRGTRRPLRVLRPQRAGAAVVQVMASCDCDYAAQQQAAACARVVGILMPPTLCSAWLPMWR
jgi:hypothetical protein